MKSAEAALSVIVVVSRLSVLERVEEAGVVDGDRRTARDLGGELEVALVERPSRLACRRERQRADGAAAGGQRNDERRAQAELADRLEQVRPPGERQLQRLVGDLPHELRFARVDDPVDAEVGARVQDVRGAELLRPPRPLRVTVRHGHRAQRAVVLAEHDRAPVGDARHGEHRDAVESRVDVERGGDPGARLREEPRPLLRAAAVVDVDRGADVAGELAAGAVARHALVEDPAVRAVVPPQPVLEAERPPLVEACAVEPPHALDVVRMDALHPALPELLLDRAARELEPAAVEVGAAVLLVAHPDKGGDRVREHAEPLLALAQLLLRTGALRDLEHDDAEPQELTVRALDRVEARDPVARDPGLAGVMPRTSRSIAGCRVSSTRWKTGSTSGPTSGSSSEAVRPTWPPARCR